MRTAALVALINAAACLAGVLAFYTYGKLTFEGYFCRPFGRVDAEIGWVLAPNATSCIGARAPFSSGPPWFEAKVFTDANGFRAAAAGTTTPRDGLLFVGDSLTFGSGVTFEESFPGQLQQRMGMPAVVAASPAYGSAQALMLADRWIDRLAPRAIIYFDIGFWERSACRGTTRPTAILKPCYWQPPGSPSAELVAPQQGTVNAFASLGIMPGGMLGVGEDTWSYFLWSRPISMFYQLMARIGMLSGFGHDFRAVGVDRLAIQRGVLDHLVRVAARVRVPVLLVDPFDIYERHFSGLPAERPANLYRVGRDVWLVAVEEPTKKLPANLALVPHDGHYGPGLNALVAALIEEQLRAIATHSKNPLRSELQ